MPVARMKSEVLNHDIASGPPIEMRMARRSAAPRRGDKIVKDR